MITENDKTILETVSDIRTQLNLLGWVPYIPQKVNPRVYLLKTDPDITLQLDKDRELEYVYIDHRYVECTSVMMLVQIMEKYDLR